VRLRFVATLGPPARDLGPENAGDEISFLPLDRIWADSRFDPSTSIEFSGDYGSYNPVNEGDLLVPKVSPTFAHGRTAIARGLTGRRALATSEVFVLRAKDERDTAFLKYRLIAPDFLSAGQGAWVGVAGLKRVSADFVKDTKIDSGAWAQRHEIADFLDRECQRISDALSRADDLTAQTSDAYLSKARELIVAPDHPRVLIKTVARPGTGHTPSRDKPEYWVPDECHVPWFGLADVWQLRDDAVDVVTETSERISDEGLANSAAVIHPAGTVLFSRTASVGFVAQMGVDMAVTQHYMTWTCGPRLDPSYLLHALRACRPEILGLEQGATHKTIYMPDLLGLKIPLPSREEQRAIVGALQPQLEARRRVRPSAEKLRGALNTYRSSLIHEAVTGELGVSQVSEQQMNERLHAAVEDRLDEVAV
jgi:type I restriction enzyme, S subunit